MSLKPNRCLILLMIIFLIATFGEGCLESYRIRHGEWLLVASFCSFIAALSLSIYMSWLLNKLRKVGLLALLFVCFAPATTKACAVCFGDPNSSITKSAGLGIAFLLGVVTIVLTAFAALFLSWSRRAKALRKF